MSLVDSIRRAWTQMIDHLEEHPPLAPPPPPAATFSEPSDLPAQAPTAEQSARLLTFVATASAVRESPRYTDSPNEVGATRTPVTAAELRSALQRAWPELSDAGVGTLMAQVAVETRRGSACYNFNLGNQKQASANQPHTYLRNVWEVLPTEQAARAVAASHGRATIASASERQARGWNAREGQEVVVFQPPHPAARFKAFASLDEGAQSFVARHQRIVARHPAYLGELNAGDVHAVAHTLKRVGYYTTSERNYARAMAAAVAPHSDG